MSEEQNNERSYCANQGQNIPFQQQANQSQAMPSPQSNMMMPSQGMMMMPQGMMMQAPAPNAQMQQFPVQQGNIQGIAQGPVPIPFPAPTQPQGINPIGMLPIEQSYIENILRLNRGKMATVYMTFEGSKEWNSKIFRGRIEAAGRDHIILSDPATGKRYLLLMVYLDYIVFDGQINYEYPFDAVATGMISQYAPR